MKKIIPLLFILFFTFTLNGFAQDAAPKIEYGKPSELKGLKKIFVDTGGDTEERERILKEFEKANLKDIILLDNEEGAEVILLFVGGKERRTVGRINNGTGSLGSYGLSTGKGIAFIPKEPRTMRVLLSIDDSKETWFDKKPALKFAREFVKIYKIANEIK